MDNNLNSSAFNPQLAEEREALQRSFMVKVYGWMAFGLLVTMLAGGFTLAMPGMLELIFGSRFGLIALVVLEFVMVIFLTARINHMSPAVAGILFTAYAALNGITLSVIVLAYTTSSIVITFGVTACTFGIMSLYGLTTQADLTKLGSLLIMGLFGIILASLANLFFQNPAIYWIVTYVGVVIFVGLIAYDTQRLKRMSLAVGANGEMAQRASILGALALYLDFINLFLKLLRILGKRR
jgi:uncharacterized protein